MTDTQTVFQRLPPAIAEKVVSGDAAQKRSSLWTGAIAVLGGVGYGGWALVSHESAINVVIALGAALLGGYLAWSTLKATSAAAPLQRPGNRLVWIHLTDLEQGTSLTVHLILATSSGEGVDVVLGTSPGAVTDALYAQRQAMKREAEAILARLAEIFPEAVVGHTAEREAQYKRDPASLLKQP